MMKGDSTVYLYTVRDVIAAVDVLLPFTQTERTGCTADGAGWRVVVRVVSGSRRMRGEEDHMGGEEKKQRLRATAAATAAARVEAAEAANAAATAAATTTAAAAAASAPAVAASAAATAAAIAAATAAAIAAAAAAETAAGDPGEVDGQGGEGRSVRGRKAKRKRLSAPS